MIYKKYLFINKKIDDFVGGILQIKKNLWFSFFSGNILKIFLVYFIYQG